MADDVEALRRERDSLARRCANRFEETQAALDVIRWLRAGRKPDLDAGLWWRNDLRVSWPMTDAHRAALRAAAADDAGVAAGPQTTPAPTDLARPDPDCRCGHLAVWHEGAGRALGAGESLGRCEITGPQSGPQSGDGCGCTAYRPQVVAVPTDHEDQP